MSTSEQLIRISHLIAEQLLQKCFSVLEESGYTSEDIQELKHSILKDAIAIITEWELKS